MGLGGPRIALSWHRARSTELAALVGLEGVTDAIEHGIHPRRLLDPGQWGVRAKLGLLRVGCFREVEEVPDRFVAV